MENVHRISGSSLPTEGRATRTQHDASLQTGVEHRHALHEHQLFTNFIIPSLYLDPTSGYLRKISATQASSPTVS